MNKREREGDRLREIERERDRVRERRIEKIAKIPFPLDSLIQKFNSIWNLLIRRDRLQYRKETSQQLDIFKSITIQNYKKNKVYLLKIKERKKQTLVLIVAENKWTGELFRFPPLSSTSYLLLKLFQKSMKINIYITNIAQQNIDT